MTEQQTKWPDYATSNGTPKRFAYAAVNQQEQKIIGLQSELARLRNKRDGYVGSVIENKLITDVEEMQAIIAIEEQKLADLKVRMGITV